MIEASPSSIPRWTAGTAAQPDAEELLPHGAKILVPFDFSPLSKAAVDTAVLLGGNRSDVTIQLVHVVDDGPRNRRQRMRSAWLELNHVLEQTRCAARVNGAVFTGCPARTLCEGCQDGGVALIVLTSHGRTGLARMIMGSVAEEVVEDAPVSVLVVKPRLDERGCLLPLAPTFKHLIVGCDHGEGAERALLVARAMARRFRSRITLVHAVEPAGAFPGACDDDPMLDEAAARLHEVCVKHMPESALWKMAIAIGSPCGVLKDVVKDATDDMIIVGPPRLTRWGHCFGDTSAGDVARLAPCAVLVVR